MTRSNTLRLRSPQFEAIIYRLSPSILSLWTTPAPSFKDSAWSRKLYVHVLCARTCCLSPSETAEARFPDERACLLRSESNTRLKHNNIKKKKTTAQEHKKVLKYKNTVIRHQVRIYVRGILTLEKMTRQGSCHTSPHRYHTTHNTQ